VALAARRADRLDAVAAGIRDQGGTALVLESDITDERQAASAVERTVAGLGRLDTLVNNAGVMLLGPAAGAPLTEWQQMVELNVLGLLYCAHAAAPSHSWYFCRRWSWKSWSCAAAISMSPCSRCTLCKPEAWYQEPA
jgi:NADP-dependent 3-hydroxy acid dehydrogenase YdfG